MAVRGIGRLRAGGSLETAVRALFASGAQGGWWDPSDLSTIFQDSAGTTPGAVNQPVGLIRDKSGRGNHRTQSTAASRPTLSARYNLLLSTQLSSGWAISGASFSSTAQPAPDGSATAVLLTEDNTTAAHMLRQSWGCVNGTTYKFSASGKGTQRRLFLRARANATTGSEVYAVFDLATGIVTATGQTTWAAPVTTITLAPDGSYRCSIQFTTLETATIAADVGFADSTNSLTYLGDGTKGLTLWGPDLRLAADAALSIPAYQRVTSASDYDTAGFPFREQFDGLDDFSTSPTGGGGTSGFFFCAAVRVDGGAGAVRTIWSDESTNSGHIVYINAANQLEYGAGNGATRVLATTTATLPVGETHIITAWQDGANISAQIDNGAASAAAFGAASAGSAGSTVGKSNTAASGYFNGGIGNMIQRFGPVVTAAEREQIKRFVASRAGVVLA